MSQSEYICYQVAWFRALAECVAERRQFTVIKPKDVALASPEWTAVVAHVGKVKGKRIALIGEQDDVLA